MTSADVVAIRRRLGISQQALAERLGVAVTTVSRWETGRSAPRGAAHKALARLEVRG